MAGYLAANFGLLRPADTLRGVLLSGVLSVSAINRVNRLNGRSRRRAAQGVSRELTLSQGPEQARGAGGYEHFVKYGP
jgi:hypothetical protein